MTTPQTTDQRTFPDIHIFYMEVNTIGRSMIRDEMEAFKLAQFVGRLKREYFLSFERFQDDVIRVTLTDMQVHTVRYRSQFGFELDKDANLTTQLEHASKIITKALAISPEPKDKPRTIMPFDRGLTQVEVLLIANTHRPPPGAPLDLQQPETSTHIREGGRPFLNTLSWSNEGPPGFPNTVPYISINSRSIILTDQISAQKELLEIMTLTHTIIGRRFLGERPGHHPLAASWPPPSQDQEPNP